jgi:integrase
LNCDKTFSLKSKNNIFLDSQTLIFIVKFSESDNYINSRVLNFFMDTTIDLSNVKNERTKYGKSSEKALTFPELDFLRYNLESRREKIILIGTAFAGMRIAELIQCRKTWMRWHTLESADGKMRVLAIDIPQEDRDIFNKYSFWKPKTKTGRTTYIFDETLAEIFVSYYSDNVDGISVEFKSKNLKSISRNISMYVIGTRFLGLLYKFHSEEAFKIEKNEDLVAEKVRSIRPKLSAHPLRSTFENLLFYKYKIDLDISASILGHSPEIARKHYVSKTQSNIEHKLAMQVIKK